MALDTARGGREDRAMSYLLVPGLGNSGPSHWQTYWERALPAERVDLDDWDDPSPEQWIPRLDVAVAASGPDTVLIAHSLGCALVAHWARNPRPIRAAMLVSTADVDSDAHTPPVCRRFAPMPLEPLPFRALVVASTDDPYVSLERSRVFADAWGARFVSVGAKGHINGASTLGSWPQGRGLLAGLIGE